MDYKRGHSFPGHTSDLLVLSRILNAIRHPYKVTSLFIFFTKTLGKSIMAAVSNPIKTREGALRNMPCN